ncbi:MAG: orotidine-5'-phosphate decarboxylase [Gammaproteobacteria bacterium]|nr:orotidine-5'-phosphate decarboxylase [Gammaproteobacteria bacterium]
MNLKSPVIVALDFATPKDALALAGQLDPTMCRVKVGKELFTASGPALVEQLQSLGFEVFLDLKFHDIPNTVAGALRAASALGVWMVNVHALGGPAMLEAARAAVGDDTKLIAVTVLTSMDASQLTAIGLGDGPEAQVLKLAGLTHAAGLDGVVCSPLEAAALKQRFGEKFCLVTPGVRPADSAKGDQKRVMTPKSALEAGSNYLVIGRPISQANDPNQALVSILESLES